MKKPLVISFYTKNTPYEEEIKKLLASLDRLGIESHIEGIESLGTWEKNCAYKPFFILQKMKEFQRPLLWVDADGVFLKKPDFHEWMECDISVRVNEFLPKHHESHVVANSVFVNDTEKARDLLEEWCLECEKRGAREADQTSLRDLLQRYEDLRFLPMPLKYSKIFDFDDLFISEEEVVIEHYQASRRHRHWYHCCH
jgi:hypothetical protein